MLPANLIAHLGNDTVRCEPESAACEKKYPPAGRSRRLVVTACMMNMTVFLIMKQGLRNQSPSLRPASCSFIRNRVRTKMFAFNLQQSLWRVRLWAHGQKNLHECAGRRLSHPPSLQLHSLHVVIIHVGKKKHRTCSPAAPSIWDLLQTRPVRTRKCLMSVDTEHVPLQLLLTNTRQLVDRSEKKNRLGNNSCC